MNKHDWTKDWELCQKATPGPWKSCEARDGCGEVWSLPADFTVACTKYEEEDQCMKRILDDADFIAEAREALPYWLNRVKELEEGLQVMFGTTDVKKARSDLAGLLYRLEAAEQVCAQCPNSKGLKEVLKGEQSVDGLRKVKGGS